MAYNNGFPMSYQQFYQPQYQPYGGFQNNQMSPTQMSGTNQQTQMMTPPAVNFPVGAGQAQMMITRDDSTIFVKSAFANGQSNLAEYIKKEPEPQKPTVDYVTREEFERRLAELHMSAEKRESDESDV